MPALSVIKNLDVLKDTLSCFGSTVVILMIYQFVLQRFKETFCHGIIETPYKWGQSTDFANIRNSCDLTPLLPWAVRDGDIDDPPCPTPAQPDELTAKLRRDTVYLSWQPSEDATSYDVYRRLNYDDYVTIANTDQNTYEDRLPGGTRGVEYFVVAVNSCGESMASNKVALSIRTKGR